MGLDGEKMIGFIIFRHGIKLGSLRLNRQRNQRNYQSELKTVKFIMQMSHRMISHHYKTDLNSTNRWPAN